LAAAKTLGVTTVLVSSATATEEGIRNDGFEPDHVVSAVTAAEMKRVLPGVFG
jgi:putative hydrolase of the HAD superfamily